MEQTVRPEITPDSLKTPSIHVTPDGRMDTPNTAKFLSLSEKTLATKRCKGEGPLFVKIGGKVFYYVSDCEAWIRDFARSQSTAEARNAARTMLPKGY